MKIEQKIILLRASGLSIRRIAEKLKIGKTTVVYRLNPKKGIAIQRARRRKIKLNLIAIKGGKCEKCGYNKSISALDFHHKIRNKKTFQVGDGIQRAFSFEKLAKEIKKCELLCSNCHHEKHDEETFSNSHEGE